MKSFSMSFLVLFLLLSFGSEVTIARANWCIFSADLRRLVHIILILPNKKKQIEMRACSAYSLRKNKEWSLKIQSNRDHIVNSRL
ncbi:Response regulatory domain-containing protein [Psidium guajava]|nr:Response regulatory domain-containing protein [Psidium guajava]